MKASYGSVAECNPEMMYFSIDKEAVVALIGHCEALIEKAVRGRQYNNIKDLIDVRSELLKALNDQQEYIERNKL